MIILLPYLLSGLAFGAGLRLMKAPFFELARKSVSLLDVLISKEDERAKYEKLNALTGPVILSLLSCTVLLFTICTLAYGIPWIFDFYIFPGNDSKDLPSSWLLFTVFSIGTVFPFLSFKPSSGYSDIKKLFHHLILDNYHIARKLLELQLKGMDDPVVLRASGEQATSSVIITGLARSGTTALTRILSETGPFQSLDYSNMPFLMYPRFWKRIYRPSKKELTERAQRDGILVGLASVEALEEYFFKVNLDDSFITEKGIVLHDIDPDALKKYKKYQRSIVGEKVYLAKNNNCISRYQSLIAQDPDMKVFILFRDPLEQAHSLFKQHQRFISLQEEDPFVLEYMNWLGHHEFGVGYKPFIFGEKVPEWKFEETLSPDHWLQNWIAYYEYVLGLPDEIHLIHYHDLLQDPVKVVHNIGAETGLSLNTDQIMVFDKVPFSLPTFDPKLVKIAQDIYDQLIDRCR